MEQLVISLVSGAAGGVVLGAALQQFSLGRIADLVGGAVGGGIVTYGLGLIGISGRLLPGVLDQAAGFGLNAVIMAVLTGVIGGGGLIAAVGVLKSRMAG